MKKKMSIGVLITGWLIIVSNITAILFSYIFAGFRLSRFGLIIYNLIDSIAIFPRGLPWFFAKLTVSPTPMYIVTLCWMIVVIICGYGILRFNNNARITFLILNIIHIVAFIISRIGIHAKFSISALGMQMYIFTLMVPIVYIIFLASPKVKEQFK